MAIVIRELVSRIGFKVDANTLKNANNAISNVRNRLDGIGQKARAAGAGFNLKFTLPIALGFGSIVKAASDSEETFSKFGVVFDDVSEKANKSVDAFANNFDVTSTEARRLVGNTGDLLTGLGLSADEALDLSLQVNRLAGDLNSFANLEGGIKQGSDALTKALLGERESAKTLGIVITEELVKAKVADLRATGRLTNETKFQARAIATLILAKEQSKNAIGDYARTANSTANRIKALVARVTDFAIKLGQTLQPVTVKVLDVLTKFTKKLSNLSVGTQRLILVIGGLIAILGPLLTTVGFLIPAFLKGVGVIASVVKSFGFLISVGFKVVVLLKVLSVNFAKMWISALGPIAGLIAGIAAVGAGLFFLFKWIRSNSDLINDKLIMPLKNFTKSFIETLNKVLSFFGFSGPRIATLIRTHLYILKLEILHVFENIKKAFIETLNKVLSFFGFSGPRISTLIRTYLYILKLEILHVFENIKKAFSNVVSFILESGFIQSFIAFFAPFAPLFIQTANLIKNAFVLAFKVLAFKLTLPFKLLKKILSTIFPHAKSTGEALNLLFTNVGSVISSILSRIGHALGLIFNPLKAILGASLVFIRDYYIKFFSLTLSGLKNVLSAFEFAFEAIQSFITIALDTGLKAAFSQLIEYGVYALDTLSDKVKSIFEGIKTFISNIFSSIKQSISNLIKDSSVLKLFLKIGKGLANVALPRAAAAVPAGPSGELPSPGDLSAFSAAPVARVPQVNQTAANNIQVTAPVTVNADGVNAEQVVPLIQENFSKMIEETVNDAQTKIESPLRN